MERSANWSAQLSSLGILPSAGAGGDLRIAPANEEIAAAVRLEEVHQGLGIEGIEILALQVVHAGNESVLDVPERVEPDPAGIDAVVDAGHVVLAELVLDGGQFIPPVEQFSRHLRGRRHHVDARQVQELLVGTEAGPDLASLESPALPGASGSACWEARVAFSPT